MPSKISSKEKTKAISAARKAAADPNITPQWPPLRPLVPTIDLAIDTVLEDQIILIRNLFTSSLCRSYVSFLSTLPLITTPNQPKKGDALRVNDRFQVNDPVFAENLWSSTGLKELVIAFDHKWGGDVCGLNPRIRIYRYRKNQFFDQHYDESNTLTLPTDPPTPVRTTWTLLIYLTGPDTGCVGGETVFYPEHGDAKSSKTGSGRSIEPIVVQLEAGMACLHKHGQDCLLHEGKEVSDGEKWVIRSDLCVER
ncbi:hypothetical protein MMC19_006483 [Ptychographa xylographoides]|nr:hypothetical protein [Ptychographa xylographoides]